MKYIYILLISIFITSCASLNSGYITGVAPAVKNNFNYIANVYGKSQATYILGIGGMDREGLVREAKNNLITNNSVEDGQMLVNFTVDEKKTFYLGIVHVHTVIVSADILEFKE